MVRENDFDAVLMDIQMPLMDGYAATRKIREREEKLKAQSSKLKAEDRGDVEGGSGKMEFGSRNGERGSGKSELGSGKSTIRNPQSEIEFLPIIAMTAHAMAGDREKSLANGMNDHVAKPIDPNELFTTLEKWILPADNREQVQMPPIDPPASAAPETSYDPSPPQSLSDTRRRRATASFAGL